MCASAIDRNALNGLFDNQQKLDDLFDSIFDDDNYFISSVSSSVSTTSNSACDFSYAQPYQSRRLQESLLAVKQHNPYFFVLPVVLEITVIYFVVSNFL
ncbi:MAG: hypothetical protein RL563_303 [Pseudomonadota bacterium]|jgi:hypothetical protein